MAGAAHAQQRTTQHLVSASHVIRQTSLITRTEPVPSVRLAKHQTPIALRVLIVLALPTRQTARSVYTVVTHRF